MGGDPAALCAVGRLRGQGLLSPLHAQGLQLGGAGAVHAGRRLLLGDRRGRLLWIQGEKEGFAISHKLTSVSINPFNYFCFDLILVLSSVRKQTPKRVFNSIRRPLKTFL